MKELYGIDLLIQTKPSELSGGSTDFGNVRTHHVLSRLTISGLLRPTSPSSFGWYPHQGWAQQSHTWLH
jgi:hypothetical protein